MTEVVVAGGGLAGLVAARHLADAGADVRLYERHHDLGGRVRSLRRDGFVFDRGFQVLFTAYPAVRRELDLDSLDLRYFKPGAVVARPGERSTLADPFRDVDAALETALNREVTLRDKLNVLELRRELADKPDREIFAGSDSSTREYLRERGFSERFVDNFAAPFYGGITLDRSLKTSKKVFEFTFKMLTVGRIAVPARGMAAITERLAESAREAGVEVVTDETVTDLRADDRGPELELGRDSTSADAAVVATDPKEARELTGVESIPTDAKGCVTQYYAFDGPELDAGERLLLNAESDAPNQIAQLSSVAPEYAPEDRNLLSATFLGVPDDPDEDLAAQTARTLDSWYPERRLDLETLHTSRVEFAQFAQPPGVHRRLPDVDAPDGPVYLAGEFTEASSLNAAMTSGRTAAKAVAEDFDLDS
ncbi:NAD(P)/FAD-dependent oxidoreductase [Halorussus gelatinilyticus]|uniref:NAD(P)/FAD-dependent oxidoreductase n=1 Tax=Halorussus gelatinilyticus TaxID=2937524 RepID=A0A8U0IF40_9EURY|nr:NAD(P)/FAD-dependent oxidoreductase [Halorussus gelatinilyticus]UPV99310.1 NAD(P)/FAD-dependent oxidoreductase [Halorussus gelatinilyticus]